MSDEITQADQLSDELSDEELESVAAGYNLASLMQLGGAVNSGSGTAINIQIAIINETEISGPSSGGEGHHHHHHQKHHP